MYNNHANTTPIIIIMTISPTLLNFTVSVSLNIFIGPFRQVEWKYSASIVVRGLKGSSCIHNFPSYLDNIITIAQLLTFSNKISQKYDIYFLTITCFIGLDLMESVQIKGNEINLKLGVGNKLVVNIILQSHEYLLILIFTDFGKG